MCCNPPWNTTEPQNHSSLNKCQNKNIPHRDRLKHSEILGCLNIDKNWYALLISRDFSFEWKINQIQQQQQVKTKLKTIMFLPIHLNSGRNFFCHMQSQWHHSNNKIYRSEATFDDDPSPVQTSPQALKLALLKHPQITLKRASTIHCFLHGYFGIVDTVLHNGLWISLRVVWFQFKHDLDSVMQIPISSFLEIFLY